jgi:DNA (cytosine-5)-methyltransferase 1
VIILENVEEFKTWGPLVEGYADINQKGRTFKCFINALKRNGYAVEFRELTACDYGAPTSRKRFFLVARSDGHPIKWPEKTHGKGLLPYRTAAEIIDWSLLCPSIFDTAEEIMEKYGVRAVRPLAENTLARIAKGLEKYVLNDPDPFIIQYHQSEEFRGQDVNEPLRTVDAAPRYGLVKPYIAQVNHGGEGYRGQTVDDPLQTITAKHGYGIVTPYVMLNNENNVPASVDDPVRTITTGNRNCLMTPTLIQTGYGEREGQAPRVPGLDKPLGTIVSTGKHALVSAFMTKHFSGGYHGHGNSPKDPLGTVTGIDHNAVVTSNLAILRNHQDGKPMTEPMPTIMTSAGHFTEVRAFLVKYYGNDQHGADLKKPLGTVVSHDKYGIVTIHGQDYMICDIGMRMLTPRELYNAQGFPVDYIIDHDYTGKIYTKTKQVARCGNAVPPPFAEALVRANLPEMCGKTYDTMDDLMDVMV